MKDTAEQAAQRRRLRDRARTEADLLEATFDLLQRDGIFAGLNLQEVADRAKVNRGQIYQYFGDRRQLLRAAVAYRAREWAASAKHHWEASFLGRRTAMFRSALANPGSTLVEALLAIDGDPDYHALPEIDRTRAALERDQKTGDLPPHADAVAMHAFMVAAYKGYLIFRTAMARDLGVTVTELDARILAVHDEVAESMAQGT
ncbi:MAG TPA: helix-turn-helix domain-containing protein [Pseudonocardiaceae bacterium]|nr:helix-turn-helix domain-containing protein [Pseudonocardiaceae bacterium]